jgi:hypothetical protein
VREGKAPKSQGVSGVRARVTLPNPSRGLGESLTRVLFRAYMRVSLLVFSVHLEWSLHAPFIASRRCRVTRCWCVGDPCRGSSLGASGGLIRWRRGLYCRGMASVLLVLLLHGEACVPLLEGVVCVFQYCSNTPRHTWSCSRRGVLVLIV